MSGETDPRKDRMQEILKIPTTITAPQARYVLGIGEEKLYQMIRMGEIPILPGWSGGAYRIPVDEFRKKFGL